jgi:hypothetical protein
MTFGSQACLMRGVFDAPSEHLAFGIWFLAVLSGARIQWSASGGCACAE